MSTRKIILCDGTSMGDNMIIFETNAPEYELKKLEKFSCQVYLNGGDSEDVPIWAIVLNKLGYKFEYVNDHQHVTAYGTSKSWLENNYPEVKESYIIENQV